MSSGQEAIEQPAPVVLRDSSPNHHHTRSSIATTAAATTKTRTSATSTIVEDLEKTSFDIKAASEKQPYANTAVHQQPEPKTNISEKHIDLEAQRCQPNPAGKKPWYASLRYTVLNIYRRLFTLVFLANIGVFVYVMVTQRKLMALINAAAANVLACGLARQPLVVNTIFYIVCSIPRSWPLRLRRIASKVYHYGGVHSGCGIASFVWYTGFVGVLTRQYASPPAGQDFITEAPIILSYIILALLIMIIVVAYPGFRMKLHDYFELTHRFSGWLVVALFVVLLMVFSHEASSAQGQSLGQFIIQLPAFWFLMVTVVSIIHPWVFLRKVRVQPEPVSPHAIRLHLDHTTTSFGKGIQLSRHPLRDWHGFATFPDPEPYQPQTATDSASSSDGETTTVTTTTTTDPEKSLQLHKTPVPCAAAQKPTFSCLVSKAGDWTSACINDPPTHLWKRGVLLYGFAYAMRVYRRLIVVTTGSGIGPCLSFLGLEGADRPAMRVVWQTRAPGRTYGQGILDLVGRMDPDPLVIDSNVSGRVDMVPVVRELFGEFGAEAVCVISNPGVTKKVVFELEAQGVPAFGPIFDS